MAAVFSSSSVGVSEENLKLQKEYIYLTRLIDDHLTQNQSRNSSNKANLPQFYGKSHSAYTENHYRKNAFIPSTQNGRAKNLYKIDRTQSYARVISKPTYKSVFNSQSSYSQESRFQKYSVTNNTTSLSRDKFKFIKNHSSHNAQMPSLSLLRDEPVQNKQNSFQNILNSSSSSVIESKVKSLIKSRDHSSKTNLSSHHTAASSIIPKTEREISLLTCNESINNSPKYGLKSKQCTIKPKTETPYVCGRDLCKQDVTKIVPLKTSLPKSKCRSVDKSLSAKICDNTCVLRKENALSLVQTKYLTDQNRNLGSCENSLQDKLNCSEIIQPNSLQTDSSRIQYCDSPIITSATSVKKPITENKHGSQLLLKKKVTRSSCFCDSAECKLVKAPLLSENSLCLPPRAISDIQFNSLSKSFHVPEPETKPALSNLKSKNKFPLNSTTYIKPEVFTKNKLSHITKHSSTLTSYTPSLKLKRRRLGSVSLLTKDPLQVVRMIKTKYKVVNKKHSSSSPHLSKVLNTRYRIINKRKVNANIISNADICMEIKTKLISNAAKPNENTCNVSSQFKTTPTLSKPKSLVINVPDKNLTLPDSSLNRYVNENKHGFKNKLLTNVNASCKGSASLVGKNKYKYIKVSDKSLIPVIGKNKHIKKKTQSCLVLTAKMAKNKFLNKSSLLTCKNKYKFIKVPDGFSPLSGKSKYKFVKKKIPSISPSTRILKTRRKLINKSANTSNKHKNMSEKSINVSGSVTPKCRVNKNCCQGNAVKVLKTKFRVVNRCSSRGNLNASNTKSFKADYQLVNKSLLPHQETSKTRYSIVNYKSLHPLRTINIKGRNKSSPTLSQRKMQLSSSRKLVRNRSASFTKTKFKFVNVKNTSPSLTLTRLIKNKYKLVNRKAAKFSLPLSQSARKQRYLWQNKKTFPWLVSGTGKLDTRFSKYGCISNRHVKYNGHWRQQKLKQVNTSRKYVKKVSLRKKRQSTKMVIIGGLPYQASKTKLSKAFKRSPITRRNSISMKNKAQTLVICGIRYQMDPTGKVLKKIPEENRHRITLPKVTRLSLGGETYVQTQPGVLTKTNFSQVRILANRVVNRSIHRVIAGDKKKMHKNNMYCMFYNRFGKCNKGDECQFIHDPLKVAVCTRFLRGTCRVVDCSFSHEVSPDKMPVCYYFLEGNCTNKDCPYRHIEIDPLAEVCKEFLKGYCHKGKECVKTHILICPTFAQKGKCDRVQCPLPHPPKRSKKRQSSPASNSDPNKCTLQEVNPSEDVASRKEVPFQINKRKRKDLINENCHYSEQSSEISTESLHSTEQSERYFNCRSLINELLMCKTLQLPKEDSCENNSNNKIVDSVQNEHYNRPVQKKLTSLPEFIPLETNEQGCYSGQDFSFSNPEMIEFSSSP